MAFTSSIDQGILSHIKCAVCNAPVKEAYSQYVAFTDEYVFKVRCHGDEDNCRVTPCFLAQIPFDNALEMVAFQTKRLPHNLVIPHKDTAYAASQNK